MPFKNKSSSDLLTFEQANNLPEYAAILADNVVLIDVDEENQARLLLRIVVGKKLNCKVYKTTRGMHFLFMNKGMIDSNRTHCTLGVGIKADIKLGCRNSYHIVKFNEKCREVLYDTGEYENVPKYLTPVITKMNVLELKEGDGRNQSLYSYILPLQNSGFNEDDVCECIRTINEYCFEQPLSEMELNTILRDDAFTKPSFFDPKGTFLFNKFAEYLHGNSNIIKLNNQLHIYRDGIYVTGDNFIEGEMIKHIQTLNKARRSEVTSYLNILVSDESERCEPELIAFKNGLYDISTDEFHDFSPDNVITNKLNCNYNPDAYSEIMDKTLDKMACGDKDIRSLLEEVIGSCFYSSNQLAGGKAFVLLGDKANGKSTFLSCLLALLGVSNVAALDMKELASDFKTAELFGKLACVGDDIGDEFIPNPAIFKKLVTGNRVNCSRKYGQPFDFDNYSKLIFSANDMPRIKDKTGAVQRRLVLVPFDATFSKSDPDYDPYISRKLLTQESLEYLAKIGLEGLKRVIENREYTKSSRVDRTLREYETTNNPIVGFLNELDVADIENQPTSEVYRNYNEYCLINHFQPMSNIEFSKQVKKRLKLNIVDKRINGVKHRIFVK
jgi:putative DNA primase/helicase